MIGEPDPGATDARRGLTSRAANLADVPGIASVSQAAGQPDADSGADDAYVELLLQTATVRVIEEPQAGAIIAWGAVRSGPLGCMLTDLFVHPDRHGRGVGGALLLALWPDHTAPGRFTFSSQHASALPLYVRAGLQPSWPLLYLSGSGAPLSPPPMHVERVDTAVAYGIDSQLSSGNRSADYAFWTRSGSGQAIVVHADDRAVAAGVLRGGNLVHLTCSSESDADAALRAALRAAEAANVTLCLPGQHPSLTSLLRAGFRIVDYDVAMSTPDLSLPVTWAYSPGLS
jgi:GNAT superfamily N-acetyltransferase